jgi:hypothetical protein
MISGSMELRYENLSINRYVAKEIAKIQNALIGWNYWRGKGWGPKKKAYPFGTGFLLM